MCRLHKNMLAVTGHAWGTQHALVQRCSCEINCDIRNRILPGYFKNLLMMELRPAVEQHPA